MTSRLVRYLSHPQVQIEPEVAIHRWSLNALGHARVAALAASGALTGTTQVFSSAEVKALQTAKPLAEALGCIAKVRPWMHENDRTSTGYLPAAKFESVADQFFAHPDRSTHGWETAQAAQVRILGEVNQCLVQPGQGDILLVGHGAVGTLLYCALAGLPISRAFDQPDGGGCYFGFDWQSRCPLTGWQRMETLYT